MGFINYDEEQNQQEMYWQMVEYAKQQLIDYYGTGAQMFPAMYFMLGEIENWTPEQILSEARKNNLI